MSLECVRGGGRPSSSRTSCATPCAGLASSGSLQRTTLRYVSCLRLPKHNTNHIYHQRISFENEIPSWGSQAGNISQTSCPISVPPARARLSHPLLGPGQRPGYDGFIIPISRILGALTQAKISFARCDMPKTKAKGRHRQFASKDLSREILAWKFHVPAPAPVADS